MSPRDQLSILPPELLLQVLSHLPVASLLSFGLTSHPNHDFHYHALKTLHIAAFPKRIHSLLSFLDSSTPFPSPNHVATTTKHIPRSSSTSPTLLHSMIIKSQNDILSSVLPRHGRYLQTLAFYAHDILPCTALALAQHAPQLQDLTLSFLHPHARPSTVPRSLIEEPSPPSPLWNAIAGIGPCAQSGFSTAQGLRNLHTLTLVRVSITSFQLLTLISHNDRLRSLRLRKCPGVDDEFLTWLGTKWAHREKLHVLELEDCDNVTILTEEDAAWISGLKNVETLSLASCASVSGPLLTTLNVSLHWNIPDLIPPLNLDSPVLSTSGVLEVDPEYAK
ncbi:MAG: hypothetical protein Q9160_007356 [Pyrenula sp. 1 TL-2023]